MLTSNFEMQTSNEYTDVPKWIRSELKMWNKEESMWLRIATIYTSMYRLISSIKWRRSLTLFFMSTKFNFQCKKKNVEESECRFIETLRLNKICIRNTEEWISHDFRFVYAFFFFMCFQSIRKMFSEFSSLIRCFSSFFLSASVFYFVAQER